MDLSWTTWWHILVYAISLGFGFGLGWTVWNAIWTGSGASTRVTRN